VALQVQDDEKIEQAVTAEAKPKRLLGKWDFCFCVAFVLLANANIPLRLLRTETSYCVTAWAGSLLGIVLFWSALKWTSRFPTAKTTPASGPLNQRAFVAGKSIVPGADQGARA
jgi:hypothetical protein